MTHDSPNVAADECVFCAIVATDQRNQIFYSDDDVVAFLDIAPATRGHTLVVPRAHAADVFAVDGDRFGVVMRGAWRVARLLEERLKPEGLTLVQSNGAAGWQDVFHLHIHLIPRYAGDGLVRPWAPQDADAADLRELTDILR